MNHKGSLILEDCDRILRRVDLRPFKNTSVLITGANGLIGQYLVSTLYAANRAYHLNCRVLCVSRHGPSPVIAPYLSDPHITFKKADLAKPFKIPGTFDYIFHAAGYGQPSRFVNDPAGTIATNATATGALLQIATRSKGTFVFFSSAEVYGDMPEGMTAFKETYVGNQVDPEGPRAIYAAAKRLAEALILGFAAQHGTKVKIVRISAVYGPGAPKTDTRVMSDFIRKALSQKEIALLDAGTSKRTYGYVADVAAMILYVAIHGKSVIYNVGGKDTMSMLDLAERIGKLCGATVRIPPTASRALHVGRDPKLVKLNLSKIQKEMGHLSFLPFQKGVQNTVNWALAIDVPGTTRRSSRGRNGAL